MKALLIFFFEKVQIILYDIFFQKEHKVKVILLRNVDDFGVKVKKLFFLYDEINLNLIHKTGKHNIA